MHAKRLQCYRRRVLWDRSAQAPDLLVGSAPHRDASSRTGTGRAQAPLINTRSHPRETLSDLSWPGQRWPASISSRPYRWVEGGTTIDTTCAVSGEAGGTRGFRHVATSLTVGERGLDVGYGTGIYTRRFLAAGAR